MAQVYDKPMPWVAANSGVSRWHALFPGGVSSLNGQDHRPVAFGKRGLHMADGPEATIPHGFLAELKRRRVIRVLVLYAIAGWIVIEVASVVLPALNLPQWAVTLVTVLVALGFPIALALAWATDIGPGGLRLSRQRGHEDQRSDHREKGGGEAVDHSGQCIWDL